MAASSRSLVLEHHGFVKAIMNGSRNLWTMTEPALYLIVWADERAGMILETMAAAKKFLVTVVVMVMRSTGRLHLNRALHLHRRLWKVSS